MPFTLRKQSPPSAIGLDIDGTFLAAVQTAGNRLSRAATVDLAPGLLSEGDVADVAGLSAALKDFFEEHKLPKRVRLGVSNQQIAVREMRLPPIHDDRERTAAVRFEAAETLAMPLDEAILDHQVIGEDVGGEGPPQMRVVVVAARESMILRLLEAVRSAGLRPEGVDLNAFALVRSLGGRYESGENARVYCHLAGVTNLAIAQGSSCVFTRPLSTAWDGFAEDTAGTLAEEIRLSIDFYMAQPEARLIGDVVLSGPGSQHGDLTQEFAGMLGLNVSVADPMATLDSSALPGDQDPHRYTVAAGLAMGAAA